MPERSKALARISATPLRVSTSHSPLSPIRPLLEEVKTLPQGSPSHLPDDLAETLAPHHQRALEHPFRRRILRALDDHGESQTLVELADLLPDTSISTIGYHALVLEECGTISVTVSLLSAESSRGSNSYASNIGDDRAVRAVLNRMRPADETDV
jgi:hypothetical protein